MNTFNGLPTVTDELSRLSKAAKQEAAAATGINNRQSSIMSRDHMNMTGAPTRNQTHHVLPLRKRPVGAIDSLAPAINNAVASSPSSATTTTTSLEEESRLIRLEQARRAASRSSLASADAACGSSVRNATSARSRALELQLQQRLFELGPSSHSSLAVMAPAVVPQAPPQSRAQGIDSDLIQRLLRDNNGLGHGHQALMSPQAQAVLSNGIHDERQALASYERARLNQLLGLRAAEEEVRKKKALIWAQQQLPQAQQQQNQQQAALYQDILFVQEQEQRLMKLKQQDRTNKMLQQQQQQQQALSLYNQDKFSSHVTSFHQDEMRNRQIVAQLAAVRSATNNMGNNGVPFSSHDESFAGRALINQAQQAKALATITQPEQVPSKKQPSSNNDHNIQIYLPTDTNFLTEAHCFLRSLCIEPFVSTPDQVHAPGKGSRPMRPDQVGFRCVHCRHVPRGQQANQAVCFPSKRENIFESVRNFQRLHIMGCAHVPPGITERYREIIARGRGPKRSQRLVRAYCAQAASEVGLVDTPQGLSYVAENDCAGSGPSKEMRSILEAARAEERSFGNGGGCGMFAHALEKMTLPSLLGDGAASSSSSCVIDNADIKYGKFSSIATDSTKQVLSKGSNESSPFVLPEDFDTISDYVYLLFHQVLPCKPTESTIKRRRLNPEDLKDIPGLCCKYCHEEENDNKESGSSSNNNNGMYFPRNITSLGDSSFSQTLHVHLINCECVPPPVRMALMELKELAKVHNACVKRGSKKIFVDKVWRRMEAWSRRRGGGEDNDCCSSSSSCRS